ncbi:MAG: hypothetical protein GY711_13560 [bacterium]|nr:hypothetical protein [bacterium]
MNTSTRILAGVASLFFATVAAFASGTLDEKTVDVEKELRKLAKRHGIEVVYKDLSFPVPTAHGPIVGKSATAKELEAYVPLFIREFGRYPDEFVKRLSLKRIVLCRTLVFDGQLRTAIPDFQHRTMYYDAARSMTTIHYARTTIHHELFHMADWLDDGLIYKDTGWLELNDDKFRYGSGGENAQGDRSMSLLTDRYPGFLTKYSTTGVEEDKAEVFAHLFVCPDIVAERIKSDRVLEYKVARMKGLLESFCKKFDRSFWRKHEKDLLRERKQAK